MSEICNTTGLRVSFRKKVAPAMLVMVMAVGAVSASGAGMELDDDFDDELSLIELSLEELMSIRVTSVAGVEMGWFTTPSAMYVITAEDIRRTGHQSLPEAMRMVPGLHVGKTSSSGWAISSRGFNDRYANKLLVRIDGRTVYDPFYSGVNWHKQHVLLEDIDRIEVVRGPGATLWGANAVNGVINVTTRSASETQGLYLSGLAGSYHNGIVSGRYGDQIDDDTHYRVWATHRNLDEFETPNGDGFSDSWDMTHGGFRIDRQGDDGYTLTLQGDAHGSTRVNQELQFADPQGPPMSTMTMVDTGRASGANLLARISQETRDSHGWSLQAYHDYNDGRVHQFRLEEHTTDIDFRHHFMPMDDHELIWGLGYRFTTDKIRNTDTLVADPTSRDTHTFSGFIQDTITIVPDRLFAMVGSKFEHNSYTGFEYQPSGRLAWTPDERQTIWASVSRAVRTPARVDTDVNWLVGYTPFPPPNDRVYIRGNPDLNSEALIAYEAGYRVKLTETLAVDTATFINDYKHLIGVDPDTLQYINRTRARSYGVETAVTWHVASNWRLNAHYTFLYVGTDDGQDQRQGSPRHQVHLRSFLDVTDDVELNTALYFNDRLYEQDVSSYLRWDLGVTWHVSSNLEISAWGQNLLQRRHTEFHDEFIQGNEASVPRSAYIQATMRF